jgi:hypothetical protein
MDDRRFTIAVLLAAVAAVAALVAWRGSVHSDSASDTWQQSLRAQVKHDAAVVEDVRYAVVDHGFGALAYLSADMRARAYRELVPSSRGAARAALQVEAGIQTQLARLLGPNSQIVDEGYLDGERIHFGRYLADVRDTNPDLVALDADSLQAEADEEFDTAVRFFSLTVLLALSFAFGALAQGFKSRHRLFMSLSGSVLVVAALAAVWVEVS